MMQRVDDCDETEDLKKLFLTDRDEDIGIINQMRRQHAGKGTTMTTAVEVTPRVKDTKWCCMW